MPLSHSDFHLLKAKAKNYGISQNRLIRLAIRAYEPAPDIETGSLCYGELQMISRAIEGYLDTLPDDSHWHGRLLKINERIMRMRLSMVNTRPSKENLLQQFQKRNHVT